MLHRQDKETGALADELATLEVFTSVGRPSLLALAAAGRIVHLPTRWALIKENTPADSCYVLLSGDTEVRHGAEVVARLRAGALVGEASLVSHLRRNATVVTTTEVRALRLGFEDLTALFVKHPDVEQVFRLEWERRTAV